MKRAVKCFQRVVLAGMFFGSITGTAWAEHISVHNESGMHIQVSCHDHGHTGTLEPGQHATLRVNHSGDVQCHATDTHGTVVLSRNFHIHGDNDATT